MYETLGEAIENKDVCPNCNGNGRVVIKNVRKRKTDGPIDVEIDCPMCCGTGNILCEKKDE